MDQIRKKPSMLAVIGIGLTGAISAVFPLALMIAPGLAAYVFLAGGVPHYLISLFFSAAIAYLIAGIGGLSIIGFLLVSSSLLILLLRKKRSYFECCLLFAAIAASAVYIATGGLQDALTGTKAFYSIQHAFLSSWETYWDQIAARSDMFPAAQIDLFRMAGRQLGAQFPVYMPAVVIVLGAFMGLFNTQICARLSIRWGANVKPMRKFYEWSLPKSFSWGILSTIITLAVAAMIGVSSMDAILAATVTFLLAPLFVQGLSVFVFLMHTRRKAGNGIIIAAFILLAIWVSLSVIMALVLLGIIEQFAQMRRRIIAQQTKKSD